MESELQGILTPFDRLDGFERRIERGPRQRGSGPDSTQQQQGEQQQREESIRRVGEAVRAAKAARPTAVLMDHTELPRPDRPMRWAAPGWDGAGRMQGGVRRRGRGRGRAA